MRIRDLRIQDLRNRHLGMLGNVLRLVGLMFVLMLVVVMFVVRSCVCIDVGCGHVCIDVDCNSGISKSLFFTLIRGERRNKLIAKSNSLKNKKRVMSNE